MTNLLTKVINIQQ